MNTLTLARRESLQRDVLSFLDRNRVHVTTEAQAWWKETILAEDSSENSEYETEIDDQSSVGNGAVDMPVNSTLSVRHRQILGQNNAILCSVEEAAGVVRPRRRSCVESTPARTTAAALCRQSPDDNLRAGRRAAAAGVAGACRVLMVRVGTRDTRTARTARRCFRHRAHVLAATWQHAERVETRECATRAHGVIMVFERTHFLRQRCSNARAAPLSDKSRPAILPVPALHALLPAEGSNNCATDRENRIRAALRVRVRLPLFDQAAHHLRTQPEPAIHLHLPPGGVQRFSGCDQHQCAGGGGRSGAFRVRREAMV
eukprot:IDg4558t1